MDLTRQDAWKEDEDLLLAETVLRCIRQGKTQLEGFKEVAEKLERTPAACGFRWNANVRKHYQRAIETAKSERKKRQIKEPAENKAQDAMSLDDAIWLLTSMKEKQHSADELPEIKTKLELLQEENKTLKRMLVRYQSAWEEVEKMMAWVVNEEKSLNR
ncbi:RsfA family transcriptional regulator [Thalassobacillus hwangdonensis]|uniref:RsfA family transcriptional regulator n=1 Tax=Thalassobacillus hwangdonensis TaxID=546108 RepID=A0ABW3L0F7_9BACI